jgi:hypothetical protein
MIYLASKEEELRFLRMHSSSSIVYGLAQMAIIVATQHQERRNNGNVDLKKLNLKRLVESQGDESEQEDDNDLELEPNVTLDEDSDGEGDDSDGENEVLIEAQCDEKMK